MKQHADNVPLNSRVTVDYKNKKVSFDYLPHNDLDKYIFIWISTLKIFFKWVGLPILMIAAIFLTYVSDYSKIDNWFIREPINLFFYMLTFCIILSLSFIVAKYIYKHYDRFNKIYPKINAAFSNEPTRHFVIHKEDAKKIIEIPIFYNIMLNYRAYGDFGKYLNKIKIREYNFKIQNKSKISRVVHGKEMRNQFYWKCYFIFDKKPLNGKLEMDII